MLVVCELQASMQSTWQRHVSSMLPGLRLNMACQVAGLLAWHTVTNMQLAWSK
jgi:hypothetical protein